MKGLVISGTQKNSILVFLGRVKVQIKLDAFF